MLVQRIKNSLHVRSGPLTRDLVQVPGKFGLGKLPVDIQPDDVTSMVCGFCSVGCSLNIHLRKGRGISLTPNPEYPVNLGMACPKGWEALAPLAAPDRATTPLLKTSDGSFSAVDWDTAMQLFALRFKAIQDKWGRESVAWIGTGQIVTEELAFLGALAKFGMGIVHGDSNTRQCMATSAVAYKQSFGFDAPPYTYKDLEESDVLVFVGSNACIAHPILWQRVLSNPNSPQIFVVDPRTTETAMAATHHYAIKPKSDLVFLYGIAHLLLRNGWVDWGFVEQSTSGFEEFRQHVQSFTPEFVSQATGISVPDLLRFADVIHRGNRVSFWWTMGVNQGHESTRTAQAIINLALMTGNIGKPGTGANSITGQCNAMGSRLFSNTSNLLGGRDFLNAEHRNQVARILGIPESSIPQRNSWTYDQIVQGIEDQKIKGLWVIGTNGAHSWINQTSFRKTLQKLDFLVVQDMYHTTETAHVAHLVLPAAGWGEKEGTFINSERRIGLVKKVAAAPGEALSDFNIFKLIAHYWGCSAMFKRWTSPEAVFEILKELSRDQPCDITGIANYRAIEEAGGIQWPLPAGATLQSQRRLFEDGEFYHEDRKAKFMFEAPKALPEPPDTDYPFVLLTGRGTSSQWHTQTRTGKSDVLRKLSPENLYIEISTPDARRLRIGSGEKVIVSSRRADVEALAVVTSVLQEGHVFMPMHYPASNRLTLPVYDSYSRQPAYKHCAVAIRKAQLRS